MKIPLIAILTLLALTGCERDMMSERGFALPEGSPVAGREAFIYMQCHQCHTIAGDDTLPTIEDQEPYVQLGGKVTRIKTYGELVTAIINPSHKLADGYPKELVSEDGESNMYIYNRYMTVQELIDIVMYLQPNYEVVRPQVDYPIYTHP
ncbi:MAG: cytochrome C [Gammaproteobacteria bacterium]|nr:cytochrome C [Gammaproteobacteria bacterium]